MCLSTVLSPLCTGKCTNLKIRLFLYASISSLKKGVTVLGVIMPTRTLKLPFTLFKALSSSARFVLLSFP